MQLSDEGADQRDDFAGIRGVVFDVYGTLCRYGPRRSPYKRLLSQRKAEGTYWLRQVMCNPMSLAQTADALGLELPPGELESLEHDLDEELKTVGLFPEVLDVLSWLRNEGYKISVVSNLALPYAGPAQQLLSTHVDAEVWSFQVGTMKPDPQIYKIVSDQLLIPPQELLFVGDNLICDVHGPFQAGFCSLLLDRELRWPDVSGLPDLATLTSLLPLQP
jgi:FMN phosphatase YigB (HAD superfamily)